MYYGTIIISLKTRLVGTFTSTNQFEIGGKVEIIFHI